MEEDLEKWIKEEMTIDIRSELAKHKEKVKKFIGLTENGEIIIKSNGTPLSEKDKVALYMIGKLYAHYARYVSERTVSNKELMSALNMPEGTVKSSLFKLREDNVIVSTEGVHQIKFDAIETILDSIIKKAQTS